MQYSDVNNKYYKQNSIKIHEFQVSHRSYYKYKLKIQNERFKRNKVKLITKPSEINVF